MVDIQKDHFSQKVTTDANGTEPTADTGEPVLDSGASRHILRSERYFDVTTLKTCHIPINTAGKQQLVATQTGDAKLTLAAPNGKPYDLMLQNALHLPESRRDLVSIKSLVHSHVAHVHFGKNSYLQILPSNVVTHTVLRFGDAV